MSLSLQKKLSINRKTFKDFEPIPCPECGQLAMKKIKANCTLSDGTIIPDLEYFYCSSCHSKFYDDAAMAMIEKKREGLSIEIDLPA